MKFQNFGTFEICSVGSSKIRMGEKKLENLKNLKSPTFEIFEIFEIWDFFFSYGERVTYEICSIESILLIE